MPFILDPFARTAPLTERLDTLRSRLRLVILVRAVAGGIALFGSLVLLSCLLDRWLNLPDVLRAVVLTGLLLGIPFYYRRTISQPFAATRSRFSLARMVEEEFPELGDSVSSSVEFLEINDGGYGSADLREYTIRRTQIRSESHDFLDAVQTRGLKPALGLAFGVLVVLGFFFQRSPETSVVAIERIADPYGSVPWPTRTKLAILAPDPLPVRIARGEPLDLKVSVRGEVPDRLRIEMKSDNGPPTVNLWNLQGLAEGAYLPVRLESARIQRSFTFRLAAGDAVTPWHSVQVLPPPMLVPLEGRPSPRITLDYPEYTGLAPLELADGSSIIEAICGTSLTLKAATDRPVAKAWLTFRPEPPVLAMSAFLAPLAASSVWGCCDSLVVQQEILVPIPVLLTGNNQRLDATFVPRLPGLYLLRFEDEIGIGGSRLLELRLQPDPAPDVAIERPTPEKDALALLPDAEFTFAGRATDRIFALKSVFLEYRTSRDDPPRTIPLLVPDVAFDVPKPKQSTFRTEQKYAVQKFTHPDGTPLKEGDTLILQLAATDHDNVTGFKAPGRSAELELRIVGKDQIDTRIQQALANIQGELARLREQQREAKNRVEDARDTLKNADKLRPEDVEKLIQAEQIQRQLRNRLGTTEEGLRAEVEKVRRIFRDNPLPRGADRERVESLAADLQRLTEEELPPIEPAISSARREPEASKSADPVRKDLDSALKKQKDAENTLKELLERLEPWSSAGKFRGEARSLGNELARTAEQNRQIPEDLKGKTPEQQASEQQKALTRQERLAERGRQLVEQMSRQIAEKQRETLERLQLAEEKEAEAAKKDIEAKTSPEKAKLNAEAAQLRDEAAALRQAATELRQETEALQRSLDGIADEESRQAATQANAKEKAELERLQLAEEKTADARRLREEAAKLPPDSAERKAATTKAETTEQQAADLRREAGNLRREVDELRKKIKSEGGGEVLKDQLREAEKALRAGNFREAADRQTDAAKTLEKIAGNLQDQSPPEETNDLLKKKQKKTAGELDDLTTEQELLQKKVEAARSITDPMKRAEELQKLSREQARLEEKARELASKLSRQKNEESAQELRRAARQMDNARQQLEEGNPSPETQDEILDRLDDSRDRIDEKKENTEEQLLREKLAKASDAIKAIRDRQQAAITEFERLRGKVKSAKKWGRPEATGYLDLRTLEENLSKEVQALIDKRFAGLPIYRRLLARSSDAMQDVAAKIRKQNEDILDQLDGIANYDEKIEEPAAAGVLTQQKEALRRLDQILDSLKPDAEMLKQAKSGEKQPPMPMTEGGNPPPQGDDLPPLAQLRALKALQSELVERTTAFSKANPDGEKLSAEAAEELEALRKTQIEIAELIQETAPAPREDKP